MSPRTICVVFGLCLAVVLMAMGWTSMTVIRLGRAEEHARRQAEAEENVRLALWRMDSALAPLLAQESSRPYFAYGAFYPADRAYNQMFGNVYNGERIVPSPLLTQESPHSILYFQIDPAGVLTSPQIPANNKLELAKAICATPEKVSAARQNLLKLRDLVSRKSLLGMLPEVQANHARPVLFKGNNEDNEFTANAQQAGNRDAFMIGPNDNQKISPDQKQFGKSNAEFRARAQSVQELQNFSQQAAANSVANSAPPQTNVAEGVVKPVWAGTALLLARRVSISGQTYIQGCWLDWPKLSETLLSEVRDLLPNAKLESAPPDFNAWSMPRDPALKPPTNVLAALPVRLIPGTVPAEPAQGISPLQLSLGIAWICVLLAAIAVAMLLAGAIALSERRGDFVSAVTHELRTPLTTFRMYTEMLANGMVPDEEKRQQYLSTLRVESDRLSHLVENVLAYARIERGRARSRVETVTLRELVEKVKARLSERAMQAGMELQVEIGEDIQNRSVRTDTSAVEQILFNLVDNAGKYAACAETRKIHIEAAAPSSKSVTVRVRDHGPGFAKKELRSLFRPFSKSAREAAHSAPGVGLGLALSRQLARDLGGELSLNSNVKDGACFELILPCSAA